MKKYNLTACMLLAFAILFISCDGRFDEINTNPDKPTSASAPLIATTLIGDLMKPAAAKTFSTDYMLAKFMAWSEGAQSEQYNKITRTSFSGYQVLSNNQKMLNYTSEQQRDTYAGLASFLKAYKLFYISLNVGDIPYKEALKGEEDLTKPVYDTQKEVMLQILNDLDAADEHFAKATRTLEGDFIYSGDVKQWRKAVNVFQLKVLINLSKKTDDTDLKIKERFAKIVSERPLFTSNNDNMKLVFKNQSGMIYPFHHTQTKHAPYVMLSSVLVDSLRKYEDYRLFHYGQPSKFKLDEGFSASDWEAYPGIDPSLPFDQIATLNSDDKYCPLNPRYTDYEPAEPLSRLGYSEMNFIIAEGALRGWISSDLANEYYLKGIEAGLNYVKDATPDIPEYTNGRTITESYIQNHLAKPILQLTGNFEQNLNKIITQKYMGSFLQYPKEAYYDYRRTGYPVFPINPETNQNVKTDRLPVRYIYPLNESARNRENYEAAIQRQYGGNDEINEIMWILK